MSILAIPDFMHVRYTNTQLAQGRHVKFLKMGRAWDGMMHPLLFPLAHYFARRACDRAVGAGPPLLLEEEKGQEQQRQRRSGQTATASFAPGVCVHLEWIPSGRQAGRQADLAFEAFREVREVR